MAGARQRRGLAHHRAGVDEIDGAPALLVSDFARFHRRDNHRADPRMNSMV